MAAKLQGVSSSYVVACELVQMNQLILYESILMYEPNNLLQIVALRSANAVN